MTIEIKKWPWAGQIMQRNDNRWTRKVTERQPRDCKRSQGRQRIRWKDEITVFARVR